jgi:hypothetical protein
MTLRPLWVWRLFLLGFAVVYLASPGLQLWLPPLIPFVAAAAVEAQFFFSGARAGRRRRAFADPGPQPQDLAEFGWGRHTVTVGFGDAELVLRPGELGSDEIGEWLELHRDELAALGPGRHELAAITMLSSPVLPYVPPPPAPPSRRLQVRLVQALVVLGLFAGLFLLDTRSEHWQHLSASARAATVSALDRQATGIAGHPAHVICDTAGHHVGSVQDADGLAEVGGSRAWLTPQICYQLYLIRHTGHAGPGAGQAVAVLAHEAWHLHGESSEALANCFAYQSGVHVGEALGLSASIARGLMRQQLADNSSDFADTPAYIVPSGCRQGGSFDLHLDGGYFP